MCAAWEAVSNTRVKDIVRYGNFIQTATNNANQIDFAINFKLNLYCCSIVLCFI